MIVYSCFREGAWVIFRMLTTWNQIPSHHFNQYSKWPPMQCYRCDMYLVYRIYDGTYRIYDGTYSILIKVFIKLSLSIRISGIYWVCWSSTSLCHINGHIETMPAKKLNPSPPWPEFDPCHTMTSNHQQVDKIAPQTAQSSGLAEFQVDNYCQITEVPCCLYVVSINVYQYI